MRLRAFRPDAGQVRERVDQSLDGAVIGQCHGSPLLGFHKIRDYAVLTIALIRRFCSVSHFCLRLHRHQSSRFFFCCMLRGFFCIVRPEILDFFHLEQSGQIVHA